MSILDDPRYDFIKKGKFTTEVIHVKTLDKDGNEVIKRKIKFRPLPKEEPAKPSESAKSKKSNKSSKNNSNFIPLFDWGQLWKKYHYYF